MKITAIIRNIKSAKTQTAILDALDSYDESNTDTDIRDDFNDTCAEDGYYTESHLESIPEPYLSNQTFQRADHAPRGFSKYFDLNGYPAPVADLKADALAAIRNDYTDDFDLDAE